MKRWILILGGARSGKSRYAQQLAWELGGEDVLYVATAEALDEEMRRRIAAHRAERPQGWATLEVPLAVAEAVKRASPRAVVLLDCMTLLVSNLLMRHSEDEAAFEHAVESEIAALLEAYARGPATWIVVSNEVGLGLVPDNRLGRIYRDALGRVNQRLAAQADQVVFMVAGIPWEVKGGQADQGKNR